MYHGGADPDDEDDVWLYKAHRLVYHSTLGWRVIQKKKEKYHGGAGPDEEDDALKKHPPPRRTLQ